jgi:group I intron endonuclease
MLDYVSAVYLITCQPTGCTYVGITSDLQRRWGCHIRLLEKGKHTNRQLQSDWERFGRNAFDFTIIEAIPGYASQYYYNLTEREAYWIVYYQSIGSSYNAVRLWMWCMECRRKVPMSDHLMHVHDCAWARKKKNKKR